MRRVAVVGTVGCGKTTFARHLADLTGLPLIEKDRLLGPGDSSTEHRAAVDDATTAAGWVFDGTPFYVEDIVFARADTVVILDYAKVTCVGRALRRSLTLMLQRRRVNPHYAPLRMWLQPSHAVRWSWSTHGERRRRFRQLPLDPLLRHAEVLRFTRSAAAYRWLRSIEARLEP